ncbi:uncharacterized protein LOC111907468 [Lactuca sativa]|uniref:uncharacterized protein LOC111907468 n=1 Tax=Lactuca sativa TaxID=4236 RepID=UPI000CD91849|nr:uncharacterized protein LOC111907468 [Lactuca sativa]
MEGEGENARVEVDDEKNTEESSEEDGDEDEIVYSIYNPKVKWNVMKPVTGERNFSSSRLMNPTLLAKQFVKELVRKPTLKCKEMQGQGKGELLTAIGRDTNNQIYPIAWDVVEVENKVNWKWFLELVSEDLSLDAGRGLYVISDQHKGLVEATKEILPYVEHRQCARHIYANFRKVYNGIEFKNMFCAAAKSITEGDFKINMDKIKTLSEVIVDARKKTLLAMLEEIRLYMMESFYNLRGKAHKWEGDVCEVALLKMEEFAKDIRTCYAMPSGVNSDEIRNGFQSYGVDLEHHYCSYRLWEIARIPCVHA